MGAARQASEQDLYKQMKTSPGGVMLLVRLQADLIRQPPGYVLRLLALDKVPEPKSVLPRDERLLTTYDWLVMQFGKHNAVRAVMEVADSILAKATAQTSGASQMVSGGRPHPVAVHRND